MSNLELEQVHGEVVETATGFQYRIFENNNNETLITSDTFTGANAETLARYAVVQRVREINSVIFLNLSSASEREIDRRVDRRW
jgi:hypothetical protein